MEKEKTCKIVFSDIDGTLLTSDGQITEGTKEMILNLENKGIPFILTSARSPEGVRVIKRMLGNHAPIIAFCGGLILDNDGHEIYSKMIPLKRALELKAMLDKDFPAVACNTFGGESDLSMMHAAGFGAAMGNAPENVRRRAPMVIGKNDEEGLLKRLKEIFKD